MTRIRTYSELKKLTTFEERFDYLKLGGEVGSDTFGWDRWMNQKFYRSREWKQVRDHVIVRDEGCDLGVPGYGIHSRIIIHHMRPITQQDLVEGRSWVLDPEYLITTTHNTHNAIHYGSSSMLPKLPRERFPGDTKSW